MVTRLRTSKMQRHSNNAKVRVPKSGTKLKPKTAAGHAEHRQVLYRVKGMQNYLPKGRR